MGLKEKNILYIVHRYDYFTKDQIEILSKNFKNVYVLVRYNPILFINFILKSNFLKKYQLNNLINKKKLPDNVKIYPTPVLYLPTNFFYLILGDLHFISVDRIIKKNKIRFDIIHSHFIHSAGYVGKKIKEKYNKPLIITAHGGDIYDTPFKSEIWKQKTIDVCNYADHLITVSNKNLECINKLKIKTPVSVLPNGFRSDLFFPKSQKKSLSKIGVCTNKKIIVSIGNLVPIKGHKYLIDALKILKDRKINNFLCFIIGEGELRYELQNQINKLRLENNVKLVGIKPHEELNDWINASDIFVLPSLNEGNPTVMFECLACGKPFIGTDVGGIKDIILSKKFGYVIPKENPRLLSSTIKKALKIKWNKNEILNHSKNFNWNTICDLIFNNYEHVINEF